MDSIGPPIITSVAASRGVIVYVNGQEALVAVRFGEIVNLAREALGGHVWVPFGGDTLELTDHRQCLILAEQCVKTARGLL